MDSVDSVNLWTLRTCGLSGLGGLCRPVDICGPVDSGPVDLWTCGLCGPVDLWTCGLCGPADFLDFMDSVDLWTL